MAGAPSGVCGIAGRCRGPGFRRPQDTAARDNLWPGWHDDRDAELDNTHLMRQAGRFK
jgi:hypothetical protein